MIYQNIYINISDWYIRIYIFIYQIDISEFIVWNIYDIHIKPNLEDKKVKFLNKKFGPDRLSRFDGNWIQTNRQAKCIYTLFLGRFAPIFYFNCEHVLFVYIEKQTTQKFRIFTKREITWIFKIWNEFLTL